MRWLRCVSLVVFNAAYSCVQASEAVSKHEGVCEREVVRASAETGVPLGIFYAIALTESGRGGRLEPYALNVDGVSVFPGSRDMAKDILRRSLRAGARFVDLGCMQINYQFHRANFSSDDDMLDPVKNVDYAAQFLLRLRDREGTWTMAAARYHAGAKNFSAHQRYVCKVIENLVRSGLGAWTDRAKQACKRVSQPQTTLPM